MNPIYTVASWAHGHFVWLVAFESNQVNTTNLVSSYQQRNITVGAVDLDSGQLARR
jgi:hypothetical protein